MEQRRTLRTILDSSTAPQSVARNVSEESSFAIELTYGAGSSTTAKLQASNDGSNWVDITDSSVTLDNTGGVALWNVSSFGAQQVKLVITGDAVTCVATLSSIE